MTNIPVGIFVAVSLLIQIVVALDDSQTPPTPVFAENYKVKGLLSLPYAELNEPFTAWFDKNTSRSRTDYYGDLYKIYQFGPKSAPEKSGSKYGSIYKFAWVPSDFKPETLSKSGGSDETRRACFKVDGEVGFTIGPQTVLPDLTDFKFDSIGRCPHQNMQSRGHKCELWKLITNVGDKKNTYKMWVRRDQGRDMVIPVHYYMLGYDSLLGSHYDRYDVSYFDYDTDAALDSDFVVDSKESGCRSMPGPGDEKGERRSHMIIANPIHEFVEEPHRYDHIDHEFSKFSDKHNKSYETDNHLRKSWLNFLHNFRFINGKNRELKQYKLAVNHLADNNLKELNYLRGRRSSYGFNGGLSYQAHHSNFSGVPDSWDWSIRGAVTQVKDQAVCGSCWSFGTSGTVEGAYFVKKGHLPRLSQQQLVDCSWKYGNNGCDGGEDFRAYKYIMEAGGLATEEDYGHYMAIDGRCHDRHVKKTAKISGFYNVTAGNQEALKHAVYTYGPTSVSIDASRPTFTFYSHGVYFDEKCSNDPNNLDHSVLVVGYGVVDGKFVWQVKNSWSTYWGDNGYILMSSEKNNCGVMDAPTVPIISD